MNVTGPRVIVKYFAPPSSPPARLPACPPTRLPAYPPARLPAYPPAPYLPTSTTIELQVWFRGPVRYSRDLVTAL